MWECEAEKDRGEKLSRQTYHEMVHRIRLGGKLRGPCEKLTSMAIKFFEGTYQSLINEEANHLLKTAEKASPSKASIFLQ